MLVGLLIYIIICKKKVKGFKEAGINEANNDAQGIYERFKNSFRLKFYFPQML